MTVALSQSRAPSVKQAHEAIEHLGRLTGLYQQRRQQLAESVGLTDREWEVLEEISTEHFMPSLFARRQESSPAAVSKILRQLMGKGLISVAVSKGDARHRTYGLTARGQRTMERLRESRQRAIQEVWLHFSERELASFCQFADRLAVRLGQVAEQAEGKES